MRDLWSDLVTAAVLGTERRAFALPAADGALADLLAQLDTTDQESALLSAAAAIGLHRQAGWLPAERAAATPQACEQDELPPCPPRAQQHLAAMLGGAQRALLPEWLAALARHGWRVPAAQLPALLDLGHGQPDLRAAIAPALGARGAWLAAQNANWSYADSEFSVLGFELNPGVFNTQNHGLSEVEGSKLKTQWETGTRSARAALLIEARSSAPQLARELVQLTWASEKADDRSAFVGTFAHNLSMDDEPLLEALLDDRSKEVRRAVAGLLARLPGSRLVRRMTARAQPLLSWASGEKSRLLGLRPGQAARLLVAPPADCTPDMIRDGVEPQPPAHRAKLGAQAWLLMQVLSAVPPATWTERWQLAPAELLAAAHQSEWSSALIEGWRAAALHAGDAGWAAALLTDDLSAAELLGALPPARQEALLLQVLRGDCTPLHKHPVLELLRKTRHLWSAELTRAVLRTVYRHMRKWKDTYDYQLRGALTDEFARRIPPALLPEIAAGWPAENDVRERWQGVIDKLLITLQFRRDMLDALAR